MAIKGIFFHFSDPIFPTSIMPIIEVKKSQKNGVKKIKPNQSESNQIKPVRGKNGSRQG
jgi:hypothetical protein